MEWGRRHDGFTLIEMSIVVVIIGLVVGGILVGRDLVSAAGTRSTLSQIEKYRTAANAFRGKYGYLPGDIRDPDASSFGFQARGLYAGEGDGNGVIEGVRCWTANCNGGWHEGQGETAMFWVDLSKAGLIDGSFTTGTPNTWPGAVTNIDLFMPPAKLGQGNYIYAWSGGINTQTSSNSLNYFGISAVKEINYGSATYIWSEAGLTVRQAAMMDSKVDDGYPQTGGVTAMYLGFSAGPAWAMGDGGARSVRLGASDTSATAGNIKTCYDNGNVGGAIQRYSMNQNGGAVVNCALSFQFQ